MRRCTGCKTLVLWGGVADGERRYCNQRCQMNDTINVMAPSIPLDLAEEYAVQMRAGPCPRCKGPGPVEVHTSRHILSVVIFSFFHSKPVVGCRECARSALWGDLAVSAFGGWWGFPVGVLATPFYLAMNVSALRRLARVSGMEHPSPELVQLAQQQLALMVDAEAREPVEAA